MARYFAPITVEELEAKIEAAAGDGSIFGTVPAKDLKVSFDTENVSISQKDFGPNNLMGYRTLDTGLTFLGWAAGGDWQHPVYGIIYWDGERLRAYVPTDGNPYNTDTNRAYGDGDKNNADFKNAKKRWPEYYKDKTADDFDPHDLEFDAALIDADVRARVLPRRAARPVTPSGLTLTEAKEAVEQALTASLTPVIDRYHADGWLASRVAVVRADAVEAALKALDRHWKK